MTRTRTLLSALLVASMLPLLAGCGADSQLRGQIAGYEKLAKQAKENGAVRCAPRELAMAESHLQFAEIEIEQGFVSRAKSHLELASANAKAAYDMSPPEQCTPRDVIVATPNAVDDDTDGDGIPDSKDVCVLDPEDKDQFEDADGCPEPDNDLDGVLDAKDKCISDPEDPDGFEDEDGCPELDNDKDTVVDLEDQCPNEPGDPANEKKGCPKASLVVVTDKEIKITQQVHFENDKDVIRPESFPILDAVADVLKKKPEITLEVQGHTDDKGSAAHNKDLSKRRANSVKKYLTTKGGIDGSRLTAKGYGKDRPIVPNNSDVNRALNRRVQFIRTETGTPPLADISIPVERSRLVENRRLFSLPTNREKRSYLGDFFPQSDAFEVWNALRFTPDEGDSRAASSSW